ncbi:hypothetical protein ACGFXB_09330 [Streptomyces canus]|uniref:hypothetical protein n=1 Tax=Streptomyces canus TaxID=58343 RepID=UPI0037219703
MKYGVAQFFGTVGELASADGVDLVVVTVKVPDHREIIQSALAAGKMGRHPHGPVRLGARPVLGAPIRFSRRWA